MADNRTNIVLTASDQTRAAFASVQNSLTGLQTLASSLSGVLGVGLSVGAFAGFVKASIDAADNLNDLSKKTGIAVENLAGLQLVVDKSGTTMEMLGGGVAKLNKTLGEAANGSQEAQTVLRDLGITATDPMEAFYQLADAFGRFTSEGDKARAMSKVIGKTWTELAPALAEGGDGLRAMVEEGQRLNPITKEMALQADKFNDALSRFKTEAAGVGTSIANDLLPGMNDLLVRWNDAITLANRHGGFIKLVLGGLDLGVNDTRENLKFVRDEIEAINLQLKDAGTPQGDIAGINGERLRARLAELEAIKKTLLEIQQREALSANDKYGTGNYKFPSAPSAPGIKLSVMTDEEARKQQQALEDAFSTKPIDDYLASLKTKSLQISQEYAKLRAELSLGAGPDNPTGLDITSGLVGAREALAGGDAVKAQAQTERAKKMLTDLAAAGAPAFETGYLSRQVEAMEQELVALQQTTAKKTRDILVQNADEWRAAIKAMDPLEIPIAVNVMKTQVKEAFSAAIEELKAAGGFVVPVTLQATAGTSDLARAATKLGAR